VTDAEVLENLKQARHLLFTVDGTYKPTSRSDMAQLQALLDAVRPHLSTGDDRREHENLTTIVQRLAEPGWHGNVNTVVFALGMIGLMFAANSIDPRGSRFNGVPSTTFGWYFIVGLVLYCVTSYYPTYLAADRTTAEDIMPFPDRDDESITKADLDRAARKAAGQDTSLSDGFEIGMALSKLAFGALTTFVLPVIALYNVVRCRVLDK